MTVALATCADLPAGDEDADLLVKALADRGIEATWQVWTDPSVDWGTFDLVVVRSVWDYPQAREEFLGWASTVPRLYNPAVVLAWNSDKTYLRELAQRGVATVPTQWVEPGEVAELPNHEFVLKPSVGAGSKGVGRFNPAAPGVAVAAAAHTRALHDAGRVVLLQPYLGDVDHAGETSLIYFNGRFSHSIKKGAMLPPGGVNDLDLSESLYVEEQIAACTAAADERALGDTVLAALDGLGDTGDLLYCRVDLLPTPDGPLVIELELTEPSLFLGHDAQSAGRLAAAIDERLS